MFLTVHDKVALEQLHVHLYTRCELISLGMISLKRKRLESLDLDWKAILKEHFGKWFLIQLCRPFLNEKDWDKVIYKVIYKTR